MDGRAYQRGYVFLSLLYCYLAPRTSDILHSLGRFPGRDQNNAYLRSGMGAMRENPLNILESLL